MQLTQEQLNQILDEAVELTEQQLEILVENRIDYIKNAFNDKLSTVHDPANAKLSSDKIIDYISSKIDPTPRKTHTEWLVNRYHAGEFKLDEGKDVKKAMKQYEETAPHMENKDLKSYRSLSNLKDALATHRIKMSLQSPVSEKDETGEEKIYSQEGVEGFRLKNKATSIKNYGPNGKVARTSWCTASEGSNNQFTGYSGGKYPMRFPNGAVLQINHQSGQIKDERNQTVDIDSPRYSPYKKQISEFVKQTADSEGLGDKSRIHREVEYHTADDLQKKLDEHTAAMGELDNELKQKETNPNHYISYRTSDRVDAAARNVKHILSRTEITNDQLKHLSAFRTKDYYNNSTVNTEDWTPYLIENKNLSTQQLHTIANKLVTEGGEPQEGRSITDNVFTHLVRHGNTDSDTLHSLIGWSKATHPNRTEQRVNFLQNSPNMTAEHFARMNPTAEEKMNVVKSSVSKHIPDEFFRETMKTHPAVVMESHKTPSHILDEMTDSSLHNDTIKQGLANNPNISKQSLMKIMDSTHTKPLEVHMRQIIDRPDLEPAERSKIVKQFAEGNIKNYSSANSWSDSNRLSRDDLHTIMRGSAFDDSTMYHILGNPKMRHGDLEEVIKHPDFGSGKVSRVLSNQYIKPSTIDAMLEKFSGNYNTNSSVIESQSPAIQSRHVTKILEAQHPASDFHLKVKALSHHANIPSHFEMFKSNPRFHGGISVSKNAPPSILHELSTSALDHVRQNVAENPNTEQRTLKILATDSNPAIAAIAKKKTK